MAERQDQAANQLRRTAAQVQIVELELVKAREQLRLVVLDALAAGVSEVAVARETGLSRTTVRAWRGADTSAYRIRRRRGVG